MQCPVCAALHREHGHECETEANATIRLRSLSLDKPVGDASSQARLSEVVLESRKRQAHIAFKLGRHKVSDHPVDAAKGATA